MLIHSNSYANFIAQRPNWNNSNSSEYKDIAFTDDGKIITHGIVFNTMVSGSTIDMSNLIQGFNNTGDVSFNTFETPAESGNFFIRGFLNDVLTGGATVSITDYVLNTTGATIDSKGRVTAVTQPSGGLHLDYVTTKTYNTTLVSSAETDAAYAYIPLATSSGTSDLRTRATLRYSTGSGLLVDKITVGGAATVNLANESKNLSLYIDDKIRNGLATNDAMVFAGTVDVNGVIKTINSTLDSNPTLVGQNVNTLGSYSKGWTFKVVKSSNDAVIGTISDTTPTVVGNVEVGDMLIAVNDSTTGFTAADWTIVQSNIDGALTIVSGSTATKNTYLAYIDADTGQWETLYDLIVNIKANSTATASTVATYKPYDSANKTITFEGNDSVTLSASDSTIKIAGKIYSLVATNTDNGTTITTSASNDVYVNFVTTSGGTSTATNVFKLNAGSNTSVAVNGKNITVGSTVVYAANPPANGNVYDVYLDNNAAKVKVDWVNTWRPVYADKLSTATYNVTEVLDNTAQTSIGTSMLKFGNSFVFDDTASANTIELAWLEITGTGANDITYTV